MLLNITLLSKKECAELDGTHFCHRGVTYNLSDQLLHGAKTRTLEQQHVQSPMQKTRGKTHAQFFSASNGDCTPKRRYWLLSQFGAKSCDKEK